MNRTRTTKLNFEPKGAMNQPARDIKDYEARIINKALEDDIKARTPGLNQNQPGMNDTTTGNKIMQTIKDLAKDPRTYSTLANIGSIYAATQDDPTTASALSEVASRIDTGIQQKQAAEATVEAERIKAEQDRIKAEEEEKLKLLELKSQEPKTIAEIELKNAQKRYQESLIKKLDLETDLLRNPEPDPKKALDLENAKLKNRKLELEILSLENPEDPEAKRNSEIYDAAYKAYINKINDPKEITFRKRLEEADKVLTNLTKTSEFPYFGKRNVPLFEKRREFRQAQENFINAQLRRESGASIAESEFENARKIYLPVIGDSAEVLEQKRKARALLFAIPEFIDPTEIIKNQEQKQEQKQDKSSSQQDYTQMSDEEIMEGL